MRQKFPILVGSSSDKCITNLLDLVDDSAGIKTTVACFNAVSPIELSWLF